MISNIKNLKTSSSFNTLKKIKKLSKKKYAQKRIYKKIKKTNTNNKTSSQKTTTKKSFVTEFIRLMLERSTGCEKIDEKTLNTALNSFENYYNNLNRYNAKLKKVKQYETLYKKAVEENNQKNIKKYRGNLNIAKRLLKVENQKYSSARAESSLKESEAKFTEAKKIFKNYKGISIDNLSEEDIKKINEAHRIAQIHYIETEQTRYYSPVSNYFDNLSLQIGNTGAKKVSFSNTPNDASYLYNKSQIKNNTLLKIDLVSYPGSTLERKKNLLNDKTIDKIFSKYYPNQSLNAQDKKRLIEQICKPGNKYSSAANTIFQQFESLNTGYSNFFEQRFGFEPYRYESLGGYKFRHLNYEYLILDYYLYSTKKVNKNFDITKLNKQYTLNSFYGDTKKFIRYLRGRRLGNARTTFARNNKTVSSTFSEKEEKQILNKFCNDKIIDKAGLKTILNQGKNVELLIGSIENEKDMNFYPLKLISTSKGSSNILVTSNKYVSLLGFDETGNYIVAYNGRKYTMSSDKAIKNMRITSIL